MVFSVYSFILFTSLFVSSLLYYRNTSNPAGRLLSKGFILFSLIMLVVLVLFHLIIVVEKYQ